MDVYTLFDVRGIFLTRPCVNVAKVVVGFFITPTILSSAAASPPLPSAFSSAGSQFAGWYMQCVSSLPVTIR